MNNPGDRVWRGLLALALAAGAMAALPARAGIEHVAISPQTASIEFRVGTLFFFHAAGRFSRFAGDMIFDPADPEAARVSLVVEAGSATMEGARQTALLQSRDFFDTAEYPSLRFESRGLDRVAPDHFRLHGAITLRGVTRPLTLDALEDGSGQIEARGVIDRREFGMRRDEAFVGNRVELHITLRLRPA